MTKLPTALEVAAVAASIACLVLLAIVWMAAYLQGGTVRVAINAYNEQTIEFAIWIVGTPVLSYGFARLINRLADARRADQ